MSLSTANPGLPPVSVEELGADVPALAKTLVSVLDALLESSALGQMLPAQLLLSLLNGALVKPVEVHELPPVGVAVSTSDAAALVPWPVIVAEKAASVGVAAATSRTGRAHRTARRTRRPLGRRGLGSTAFTQTAVPASA
jgi:hypothetical protein